MEQLYRFSPYLKSTLWGGRKLIALRSGLAATLTPAEAEAERARLEKLDNIGETWEISAMPACECIVAAGPDAGATLSQLTEKYGAALVGNRVWQRFGNRFPLLIKFIDAAADLSLQVHPDDRLAMARHGTPGKTEMWYILDADPTAMIHCGLRHDLTPAEYDRRVTDGTLMETVNSFKAVPGQIYVLPPGRLHAIGAGTTLIEIQQSSDITYRVDDYGRRDASGKLRELHTEQAREAIDYRHTDNIYTTAPPLPDNNDILQTVVLEHGPYFNANRVCVRGKHRLDNPDDSFMALICLDGKGVCHVDNTLQPVSKGTTLLVPAVQNSVGLEGDMTIIAVTVT